MLLPYITLIQILKVSSKYLKSIQMIAQFNESMIAYSKLIAMIRCKIFKTIKPKKHYCSLTILANKNIHYNIQIYQKTMILYLNTTLIIVRGQKNYQFSK
jgi:hypothetical protein